MSRARYRRSVLRSALAAVALVAFSATGWCASPTGLDVTPASAAYGQYKVLTCSNGSAAHKAIGADAELVQPAASASWQVEDQCLNSGVVFVTDQAVPTSTRMAWGFDPWLKSQGLLGRVEQVDMEVSGGANNTGVRYELSRCVGCSGGTAITAPGQNLTANLSIRPWQATAAYLNVFCSATTCPSTPNLSIQNIVLHLRDDQSPAIPTLDLMSLDSGQPLAGDIWQKPDLVAVGATGSDAGAGLQSLRLLIDGSTLAESASNCEYDESNTVFYNQARLCQASRSVNHTLDFAQIADGTHSLLSESKDAVGRTSRSLSRTFKVDRVPPAEPRATRVIGAQGMWTSQELFDLEWLNEGENAETATESGLAGAWYDVEPQHPGGIDPPPVRIAEQPFDRAPRIRLPHDGVWELDVWTFDQAGNASTQDEVRVGRDLDPPAPPILLPNEWISRAQIVRGYRQRWETAAAESNLESGICGYSIGASQAPGPAAPDEPNAFGATESAQVSSDLPEGTNYVQVSAFSCAGIQSTTSTSLLRVDGTGPRLSVAGLPTDEWSDKPLQVSLSATDLHSGTKSLWYSLDFAPRVALTGDSTTVTLNDGVHALTVGAEDFTGNESTPKSSLVKVDSAAPVAQFEPRDPTRPTFISASIKDALSGVAAAWMQYRRVDARASLAEGRWTNFGQQFDGGAEHKLVSIRAELPDEKLADGEYALRVVARDRAGNDSLSSSAHPDDAAMLLDLPARGQTQLTAEIASVKTRLATVNGKPCARRRARQNQSSCRRRNVTQMNTASPSRTFEYGARAAVVGTLRVKGGAPLANARLAIVETPLFGAPARVSELATDSAGAFEYRPKAGAGRTIRVMFDGGRGLLPAADNVNMYVRAGISFGFSERRVRPSREVAFRGRLLSGGGNLPRSGKVAIPEFWNGRSWQLAFAEISIAADGRFRQLQSFSNSSGKPVRVAMRMRVKRETGWPYETGVSPVRWITVLPR